MQRMIILLSVLFGNPTLYGQTTRPALPVDEAAQIRDELQRMRSILDQASLRLVGLERRLSEFTSKSPAPPGGPGNGAKLPNSQLPASPSDDQVRTHIRSILDTAAGQTRFSSTDPQISMLVALGEKRLGTILEVAASNEGVGAFYVVETAKRLAASRHRQLVINVLARIPDLAELVREKGWEQDAREVLIAGLKEKPPYLPTAWIEAAAELRDPVTYPYLNKYLAEGPNPSFTYKAISGLPGIAVDDAVASAWRRVSAEGSAERVRMASIAARFGHRDALGILISAAGQPDSVDKGQIHADILKLIEFRGSDEDIQKWFQSNEDRLVFDRERGIFCAKDDVGPNRGRAK